MEKVVCTGQHASQPARKVGPFVPLQRSRGPVHRVIEWSRGPLHRGIERIRGPVQGDRKEQRSLDTGG